MVYTDTEALRVFVSFFIYFWNVTSGIQVFRFPKRLCGFKLVDFPFKTYRESVKISMWLFCQKIPSIVTKTRKTHIFDHIGLEYKKMRVICFAADLMCMYRRIIHVCIIFLSLGKTQNLIYIAKIHQIWLWWCIRIGKINIVSLCNFIFPI